jgi:hypothetical protein
MERTKGFRGDKGCIGDRCPSIEGVVGLRGVEGRKGGRDWHWRQRAIEETEGSGEEEGRRGDRWSYMRQRVAEGQRAVKGTEGSTLSEIQRE